MNAETIEYLNLLEVFKAWNILAQSDFETNGKLFITYLGNTKAVISRTKADYHVDFINLQVYAGFTAFYPLLVYLMKTGKLPFDPETADLFNGINWDYIDKLTESSPERAGREVLDAVSFDHPKTVQILKAEADNLLEDYQELDLRVTAVCQPENK
ncbi:MAG: hypothetical protein ACOYB8_00745 [Eubacteriaceae bacterium]|jgi:hypothetical protein